MENHSNVVITTKLRPSEMQKFRIVSLKEILLGVLQRKTPLVILEVWDRGPGRATLVEAMKQSGYRPVFQAGTKEIYKRTGAK